VTVACLNEGCGRTWPRDPVLEVACPSCRAPAGRACRRPSGHGVWGQYGRFCDARDIAADQGGAYGTCPLGKCGLANKAACEAAAEPQGTLL
jgi:hypothetical protein